MDYLHVDQNHSQQFLKMMENVMKPAYQKMVDSGDIRSWKLYIVNYPGGERSNYSFVCVVTAPEIQFFEDNFSKIESSSFMPSTIGKKSSNDMARFIKLVASEMWKVRSVLSEGVTKNKFSKYKIMDYMEVPEGQAPGYLTLEGEIAKPLHRQRAKNDQMAGWEVYSLLLPGGTEYGYNYGTGNFYDHISHIEFGFTQQLINQALPGTDVRQLLDNIYATRDLVKSEFWELVSHTN